MDYPTKSSTTSCSISVQKPTPTQADADRTPKRDENRCPRCRRAPSDEPLPRIVYKKDVLKSLRCSEVTLWRWMEKGEFPKGFMLGNRHAWLADDVEEWIIDQQMEKFYAMVAEM